MKKIVTAVMFVGVLFVFNNSMAQDIGFKGIGGRLGLVDSEGPGNSTVIFGAHANLGEIIENLKIFPSIDYWSKNSVDVFSFNGNVRYYFPNSGNIDFFAGGGLGFVRWSATGGSSTEFGLNLLGGADFPVSENLVATAQLIFCTEGDQIKIVGGITYLLGN